MKKYFLLFILTCISAIVYSQSKTTFGVKGGILRSDMRGDAVKSLDNLLDFTNGMVSTSPRTAFFAGGYASIPVSETIYLEPGFFYAQKGFNINAQLNIKDIDFLGVKASAALQSHYIDIPVLLKADLGGFNIFAGPQIAYLAKADLKTSAGLLGIDLLNKTIDVSSKFTRWDVGLTGGVGYQFNNGLNLSAAYDHGLSKVDANENFNAYNRGFKIGAGFTF